MAAAKAGGAAGLPGQRLSRLSRGDQGPAFEPGQVQPASLDPAWAPRLARAREHALDKDQHRGRLANLSLHHFELDAEGEVLEQGCVYLVEA
jgi:hypothetical protein